MELTTPDEDQVKTVRRFFLDDDYKHNYQRLKREAGAWGELKSPTIDPTGVSGSTGNATEDRFIHHAEAFKAVRAVDFAINGCSKDSQEIISKRYIRRMKVWQVRQLMGIRGNQTWRDKDDSACLEFAQCMETACDILVVDKKTLPIFNEEQNRSKLGAN